MYLHTFRAMNSNIQMGADGSPDLVENGFVQASQLVSAYEKRFTRFSTDSELCRLNLAAEKSPEKWQTVSTPMFEILSLAVKLSEQTEGLFDPSILPALQQAGYDRSMDEIRAMGPRNRQTGPAVKRLAFVQIEFDPARLRIRMPAGMQIDLGGIAKGWIAEQAARRLKLFSEACVVNAGGDLFSFGVPSGKTGWEVGIEDPLDAQRDILVLNAQPGAVTTSSITKRRWIQNGREQHHLINPQTGRSAETNWLSVTAFADHAADAEVFSKALLIAGEKNASRIAHNPNIKAFIAVERGGKIIEYINPDPNHQKDAYVKLAFA